jgi:hypothetical protein
MGVHSDKQAGPRFSQKELEMTERLRILFAVVLRHGLCHRALYGYASAVYLAAILGTEASSVHIALALIYALMFARG